MISVIDIWGTGMSDCFLKFPWILISKFFIDSHIRASFQTNFVQHVLSLFAKLRAVWQPWTNIGVEEKDNSCTQLKHPFQKPANQLLSLKLSTFLQCSRAASLDLNKFVILSSKIVKYINPQTFIGSVRSSLHMQQNPLATCKCCGFPQNKLF